EHQDGSTCQLGQTGTTRSAARLIHQPRRTLEVKLLLPAVQGVLGHADQGGKIPRRQFAPLPSIQKQQPLFHCQGDRLGLLFLDQPPPPFAPTRQSRQTGQSSSICDRFRACIIAERLFANLRSLSIPPRADGRNRRRRRGWGGGGSAP